MESKPAYKVKLAFYLGYNGRGFHGLQKNANSKTVEESLELTLHRLGLISSQNFGNLNKIGWNRGSRTDKGVHALLNVISCKVHLDDKYLKEGGPAGEDKRQFKERVDLELLRSTVNENLDKNIRIFGIFYVTKNFDARTSARSRIYEYLFPLEVLTAARDADAEEVLRNFAGIVSSFKGSHNFHNYTTKANPGDKSSVRYIIEIHCNIKSLISSSVDAKEKEFVAIYIHGQSFMYHQIRKMVGAAIVSYRNNWGTTYITNTMLTNKCEVYLAPAEGLYLERITFDSYNNKKDIPMPIRASDDVEREIAKFKVEVIYVEIMRAAVEDNVFLPWIEKIQKEIVPVASAES